MSDQCTCTKDPEITCIVHFMSHAGVEMIDENDLAQGMHENPMHWADEYLGLLTENKRLREALITIQNYQQNAVGDLYPSEILADIVKIAGEALKGGSDE